MDMYEFIKERVGTTVPFAAHTGITVTRVADGEGTAELPKTDTSINHIGSQHAGALFTLGEAASGAAMAGAFAPVLLEVRTIAGKAGITYTKIAKGTITANAHTADPAATRLQKLEADGKVAFDVTVDMTNEDDDKVAEMTVAWHVQKT